MDFFDVIQRLRPESAHLLSNNGGMLYIKSYMYDSPVYWRARYVNLTESECLDEWDVMLAERAAEKAAQDLVRDTETSAITNYANLPTWAKTGTADEAETYITNQIFNGQTQAQVDAWIDANITGTTITALRTQLIAALKITAGAVITMRGLFILTSKLLIYIRDLVIRFRQ